MDLTGDYRIPAPREAVWAALNDPEVLKACIPHCEELAKNSDTEFVAKVVVKIGPVKASFGGKVTLSDIDAPNGYTISGEGQGGAAGFAKGGAKVRLESVDGGAATILHYVADAQIGGKLAQIGSRLVEGSAKKLADEFFAAFAAQAAAKAGGIPAEAPQPFHRRRRCRLLRRKNPQSQRPPNPRRPKNKPGAACRRGCGSAD